MAFPEYKFSIAGKVQDGADARGNFPFLRAQDGVKRVFRKGALEQIREGGEVEIQRTTCRNRCFMTNCRWGQRNIRNPEQSAR
ncbi:MAG: hypothetical protein ACOX9E_00060 [Lentisphaeria bacterium]|jgi:type I restriction enzyme M protein